MEDILHKKLFKMPALIKPELNTIIYYLHVVIIAVVVLGLLQYFKGGEMLTLMNILWSIPLITFADFISHTILQLD